MTFFKAHFERYNPARRIKVYPPFYFFLPR